MEVRQALLDDTQAITALHRSRIGLWQRLNPQGRVEDVPYEALTLYQRWLHGGPWMSVETGAIHLSHLLRGAGLPLVAVTDGQVRAYAEVYHNAEPEPFGNHLSLGPLVVYADCAGAGLEDALLAFALERTAALKCQRFTAHGVSTHSNTARFYESHGLQPIAQVVRLSLPAKIGQVFYKAVERLNDDAAQINGWYMPVGCVASARQQWETLWPRTWDALPELREQHIHRLHFSAAGQEALVCLHQQLYAPRSADVYCWSPKPLTGQVLMAIRDWAHREGYRTLVMAVLADTVKTLGPEAEPDGYEQVVYGVDISA